MRKIFAFLILILFARILSAQTVVQEVKLTSGKTIIIFSNGTWKEKPKPIVGGKITDERDGHVYKVVNIGSQTWMAENLAYKYGYCWPYNDSQSNVATYGYLYNWQTAKSVCPSGWHLPTSDEFATLITYLGEGSIAGGKLIEIGATHWTTPNSASTNSSGFTALPGGMRYGFGDGGFTSLGSFSGYYSATDDGGDGPVYLNLNSEYGPSLYHTDNKETALSMRCLRN